MCLSFAARLVFQRLLIATLIVIPASGRQDPATTPTLEQVARLFEAGKTREAGEAASRILEKVLLELGAISFELGQLELAERGYRGALESADHSTAAEALRGRAIVSLHRGAHQQGLEDVQRLSTLDPSHPDVPQLQGKLRYLNGDYSGSVRALEKALKLQPRNLGIRYTLALAHLRSGELPEAEAVFDSLLRERTESAALWSLIGLAYRETADPETATYPLVLEKAKSSFQRALVLDPSLERVHYYLALTLLKSEGLPAGAKAVELLKQELVLHPDHAPSLFYLGLLLVQDRKYAQAIESLNRLCRIDPENTAARLLLARAFYWSGQLEGTIQILDELVRRDLGQAGDLYSLGNAHYLLGRALIRSGREAEGQAHLLESQSLKEQWAEVESAALQFPEEGGPSRDLGDLEGENPLEGAVLDVSPPAPARKQELEALLKSKRAIASELCQVLARAAAEQHDTAETARLLEHAAFWDDSPADIYYNLGVAWLKAGDPTRGAGFLQQDLERNPGRSASEQLLAQVLPQLIARREFEDALSSCGLLLRRHPEVPDLHLMKGQVLFQLQRYREAMDALEQALRLQPDLAEAYLALSLTYDKLGRTTESAQAMKRFRELTR